MITLKEFGSDQYLNLTDTASFKVLLALFKNLKPLKTLLADRIQLYQIQTSLLTFSYAASWVTEAVLDALQTLSEEQQVLARYARLLAGEPMNSTENRAVLHHHTRMEVSNFYRQEQHRVDQWADQVRTGAVVGCRGHQFNTVVQIGIGGSHLGPQCMYEALKGACTPQMEAHFISNIDPDKACAVLEKIDFLSTLFILVSKSGTTSETALNLKTVLHWGKSLGLSDEDLRQHLVVVTAKGSFLDQPEQYLQVFYLDEAIGGRFSVTSVVGGVLLSLIYGQDVFARFLKGAYAMDKNAQEANIRQNISLLSALIGVWERNVLQFPATALIPYAEALRYLPAHIQQLDCESNGKRVSLQNQNLSYQTGPIVWGGVGSDCQHAFFQKIHQGTESIPVQFLGFKMPQSRLLSKGVCRSGQDALNAHLFGQIVALAMGKDSVLPHKLFPGNRPSTLLWANQLTPEVLGAILAYFENRVMFQGFLWNINSFDQEGVELGKQLASQIVSKTVSSEELAGYQALFMGEF